jgi:hypothetical protein
METLHITTTPTPPHQPNNKEKTMNRPGRKPTTNPTLTIKLPNQIKQHLIDVSNLNDMSITEYLITLIKRDASTPL